MIYLPVTVLLWGGSALVCRVVRSFVFVGNASPWDHRPSSHQHLFLLYPSAHAEGLGHQGLVVVLPSHLQKYPLGSTSAGEAPGSGHGVGGGHVWH